MLKANLMQALTRKSFLLAILIVLALNLYGMCVVYGLPGSSEGSGEPFNAWSFGTSDLLYLIAPLFVTWAFSDSYFTDRQSKFLYYQVIRSNPQTVLRTKMIVTMITGGLVLFLPGLFLMILAHLLYHPDAHSLYHLHAYLDGHNYSFLYQWHPLAYRVFPLFVHFFFGAAFAFIGFVTSLYVQKKYWIILIPQALYLFLAYLLESFELAEWDPITMLLPYDALKGTIWTLSVQYLVVFIAGWLAYRLYIHIQKNEVI
jgi:hypothetical protein